MRAAQGFLHSAVPCLLCLLWLAGGMAAAGPPDPADARSRMQAVNVALGQATLIEAMAQNACFAMRGTGADQARGAALEHLDRFDTALGGLRAGHEWLGLLPQTDPFVLHSLNGTETAWQRLRPAMQQVIHGDYHSVVLSQFLREQPSVLGAVQSFAKTLMDAQGAALGAQERTGLGAASAQRMRTQRALHLLCLVRSDIGGDAMRAQLGDITAQIDAGFATLSSAGGDVQGAPNARVQRNLRTAALFWDKMRPVFTRTLAGEDVPDADLRKAVKLGDSVLKQMNQAVEGYFPQV